MQAKTLLLMLTLALVPLSGCLGFGDDDESHTHDDCPTSDHNDDAADAMDTSEAMEDNSSEEPVVNATLLKMRALQQENATAEGNETVDDGDAMGHDDVLHDDHGPCVSEHGDPLVIGDDGNVTVDPSTPNELPVAALKMTTDEGVVLDGFTAILPGQSITFSAADSYDPDGTVDLVGLIVKDTNGTRNAQLMTDGVFTDATFEFNHEGPVNVTVRVLDNRGEGVIRQDMAYVNKVSSGEAELLLVDPTGSGCTATGDGTLQPIVWQQYFHKATFQVAKGATHVTAEVTGADSFAYCDKDGNELANDGTMLAPGTQYYVGIHPAGPNQTVTWDITVHYEPLAPA